MNWCLIDDHWMNFDYITQVWVEKDHSITQFTIKCCSFDNEVFQLFDKCFETGLEAQKYLNNFMKGLE